jgi:hypothetical protein
MEDIGIDGRIRLKRCLNRVEGVACTDLAEDRDMWWAVVDTVMEVRVL